MVRIDAVYHARIVDQLAKGRHPMTAIRVWAQLLTAIDYDTREVMRTRTELAEILNVPANAVSMALTELEKLGAISRVRQRVAGLRGPGVVRLFIAGAELPPADAPAKPEPARPARSPRGRHLRVVASAPNTAA